MWTTEGEHGLKQAGEPQRTVGSAGERTEECTKRVFGLSFPGPHWLLEMNPCTHLLQLQLNDLLLKGVGFVLSLHVGLFYAVLLGTEIQGSSYPASKQPLGCLASLQPPSLASKP